VSFVKLHSSILDSSVWLEDDKTRLVWVTLLAMADRDGVVESSVPGLAHRAHVPRRACERALEIFMAPDPDSRTPDHDGRRIEKVPGGWRLLNYEPYREKGSAEESRVKNAERQQRFRERQRDAVTLRNVTGVTVTLGNGSNGDVTPPSASVSEYPSESVSLSKPPERALARSENGARLWTAFEWERKFEIAWIAKYGGLAMGGGTAAAKATGELADQLDALPETDRQAAQDRSDAMIAEFMGREDPFTVKNRHGWRWFVADFSSLRVPSLPVEHTARHVGPAPPRDVRVGHVAAEVKPRPNGKVAL
jgi:hypothetical protein